MPKVPIYDMPYIRQLDANIHSKESQLSKKAMETLSKVGTNGNLLKVKLEGGTEIYLVNTTKEVFEVLLKNKIEHNLKTRILSVDDVPLLTQLIS